MAADLPVSIVGEIASKARVSNQAVNLTGVLIFDGLHFCGLLDGRPEDIAALFERILRDPRHVDVKVLVNEASQARRFNDFALGYVSGDDVDVLVQLKQLRGTAALSAFEALLPHFDLGS
jgi:hypothetical protein